MIKNVCSTRLHEKHTVSTHDMNLPGESPQSLSVIILFHPVY